MRQLLKFSLLLMPLALGAQTPIRYRLTTRAYSKIDTVQIQKMLASMGTAGGDASSIGKMMNENVMTSSAILTVTTHDSAGGTVWRLVIDSMVSDMGSAMKSMQGMGAAPSNPTPDPPQVYQVFERAGDPITMARDTREFSMPAKHRQAELLDKMPGFGLVIPNRDIPTRVGQVIADTTADSTTKRGATPSITSHDTMIVAWKRTAGDSVVADVSIRSSAVPGTDDMSMNGTGMFSIVYDAQRKVREGRMRMEVTMHGGAIAMMDNSKSTQEYTIIRIP